MQIAVGGVSRLERHFFAFVHLDSGRDVRMPAVVSSLRLLAQWSTAVDRDGLHGCPPTVTFWPTSRLKKTVAHAAVTCPASAPPRARVAVVGVRLDSAAKPSLYLTRLYSAQPKRESGLAVVFGTLSAHKSHEREDRPAPIAPAMSA